MSENDFESRKEEHAMSHKILIFFLQFQNPTASKSKSEQSGGTTLIGPPDPISNLRPIEIATNSKETKSQRQLRQLRLETAAFNEAFWQQHNSDFNKGREEFIKKILKENYGSDPQKTSISAAEMSIFYKSFLDSKWKSHIDYNLAWQKRNFKILALAFKVKCEDFIKISK